MIRLVREPTGPQSRATGIGSRAGRRAGMSRRPQSRMTTDDPRPDVELAALAAAGDVAAYEALARRHTARIHRTAYRVVGNREDAETSPRTC